MGLLEYPDDLATALEMIVREEGLENTWARHRTLAAAVHAAVDVWSEGGALHANVADPAERSVAVTTVLAPGTDMAALREWTQEHAGLTLGLAPLRRRSGNSCARRRKMRRAKTSPRSWPRSTHALGRFPG